MVDLLLILMDMFGTALRQRAFDGLPVMGRQAIPNDEQMAIDMAQQVAQKTDNIWSTRVGLNFMG
jgi:hypothetical protein